MTEAQNDSIDFDETLSTVAKQMYAQLPEEEKKGSFGRALRYIASLGFTSKDLWARHKLSNGVHRRNELFYGMQRIINSGDNKQRFHDAFQYHQDNATAIGKIDYEIYFGCNAQRMKDKITQCQDTLSLEKNFNDAIHAAQKNIANEAIENSVKAASIIIIIQIVKLHFVWKDIFVATNLYNNSTKFGQIEENIRALRTVVEQLTQAMQTSNTIQANIISKRARKIHNQTKSLINNLQTKINKSSERLDASMDGQFLDGLSNLVTGVSKSMELYNLFHYVPISGTVLAIGVITGFVVLDVAYFFTYHITKKRLAELQKDSIYLDNLNQQLDQLYEEIEEL